ncbi:thermonuclease family protein [Paenisporosarcina sp. TG-14]|uniref:thermonuclease family protein n=1 Tax=Paenisporosarcina sp. TG-14 TaxID=1231057 RepID=UPI0002DEE1A7|nr:thermonuclease family protein [Paenisporosarcina sp. TG-14]
MKLFAIIGAIILLILLFRFPLFTIGIGIAMWAVYEWKINKKLHAQSRKPAAILSIGMVMALTGCIMIVNEPIIEDTTTESDVAEVATEEKDTDKEKVAKQTEKEETERLAEEEKEKEKVESIAKEEELAKAKEEELAKAKEEELANAKKEELVKAKEEELAKAKEQEALKTSSTTDLIPVTLVRTVDGDTAVVNYEGKNLSVRYLLIDTPETKHPQMGIQPFGPEASNRNKELINSGKLAIEFDIGERTDRYDRLLAYVYVDGVSVQETLVREGFARVAYIFPPSTRHLDVYKAAEKEAKDAGRGIWSIEDYATEDGFVSDEAVAEKPKEVQETPKVSTPPAKQEQEFFQNCTELRKVYPNGVASDHPAYQPKMDRDKDNFACEA